jgi:hypothetical protein
MKGFTDEMAAVGKHLDDEEVITYILAGLDFEYNPFVEAFMVKTEPQTLNDLYSQLLTTEAPHGYKQCVEAQKEQQQISANVAFRGGRGSGRGPMRGRGDGGFHDGFRGGRGSGCSGGRNSGNKIPCQVCRKTGHTVLRCYKHFDASYNSDDKHTNTTTIGYNFDTDIYDPLTAHHIRESSVRIHTCVGFCRWIRCANSYMLLLSSIWLH